MDWEMRARWLLAALPWLIIPSASARDLVMIAPDIPPHFQRDGGGRIGEVIRTALNRCGHQVRFRIVPFGRHWKDYVDDASLDGLATAESDQTFPGFSTKPFIHLQDGATVLERSELKGISSPEQLSGRRVVAFPAADKILGIESVVPRFKSFDMREGRFDQLRPLFAGRADAVLADGLITAHYVSQLRERAAQGQEPDIDPSLRVVFRRMFASGPQRLYFRDRALAEDFDRCVEKIKAEGLLHSISKKVIERYRSILGDQYPID